MKALQTQLHSLLSEESKEDLIYEYATQNVDKIYDMIIELPKMWKTLTTPKHTKIIKNILHNHALPVEILNKIINWAKEQNRQNLKLELILFLTNTQYENKMFDEVLENIENLIFEYKMLDERRKLADIYLLKSQTLYQMESFQKARSILSAARGISLSTICSNRSVARIDLLSGVFLCDDGDYTGAGSYFLEAITGFKKDYDMLELTFNYIIFSKIMNNDFIGIQRIINSRDFKILLKEGENKKIEILLELSEAVKEGNLKKFEFIFKSEENKQFDMFIQKHLKILYQKLFNIALKKLIAPYESVYIQFICENLNITKETALEKIQEIIMKKEIKGMIDFEKNILKIQKREEKIKEFSQIKSLLEKL